MSLGEYVIYPTFAVVNEVKARERKRSLVSFSLAWLFFRRQRGVFCDSHGLFSKLMVNETVKAVESLVQGLLGGEPGYFLVEVRIKPTNNVKVYIDGDQGISIEKCVQYNRALYKKLEESGLFPTGDFSLEVSSPGLDEPLKLLRQYKKNIGRQVELVLQDGSKKEGKLLEVSEDGVIVEETRGKNKKKEVINHTFLFDNIKTTKIQVVF
jgi:ribosome maturation factor RimP